MKEIKKIAILTSGGDAPGMNAALRAIVRTASYYSIKTVGVFNGYEGLINKEFEILETHSVSNIIQKGGTILKSARSTGFFEKKYQKQAYNNLVGEEIDALIVIGGDGSFRGLNEFCKNFPIKGIGIPGTIDNDIVGTDFTIGYDTAINTVVEAVDKIRDTAYSHNRIFLVEVMGRDAGLLALRSGIAVGAELILIPEVVITYDDIFYEFLTNRRMNKQSGIILIAEGDELGGAFEVSEKFKEKFPNIEFRVTILGHIQRGGAPTCMDRVRASQMGFHAVKAIISGQNKVMVGIIDNKIAFTKLDKATKYLKNIPEDLIEMTKILPI